MSVRRTSRGEAGCKSTTDLLREINQPIDAPRAVTAKSRAATNVLLMNIGKPKSRRTKKLR